MEPNAERCPTCGHNLSQQTQRAKAAKWLADFLGTEMIHSRDVFLAARAAGHSEKTLRRAANRLGVFKEKLGHVWYWGLPWNSAAYAVD